MFAYSSELLKELFEGLMHGDGSKAQTNWTYFTTSEQLADDFSELLLRIGWCGSVVKQIKFSRGTKNIRPLYRIPINRTRLTPATNKREPSHTSVDYDGKVYCCTVPSGLLYVRRNGKSCWCGNSDYFWGQALAVHAATNPSAPIEFESAGTPRLGYQLEDYVL